MSLAAGAGTAHSADDHGVSIGVSVGVLLAGGSSRRAGIDKRLLVLEGRTMLQRNLAFLRGLFPTVLVSLAPGAGLDLGDAGDAEIVHDAFPGASPLAGIATALAHVGRPVFALAVDIARPDRGAAERVLTAFPGHDLALPAIGPFTTSRSSPRTGRPAWRR